MSGLLKRMTAISLIIHIAFFGISLLILKKSRPFIMPSPYIVNLISPGTEKSSQAYTASPASNSEAVLDEIKETASAPKITAHEASKKPKKDTKKEERLTERIAALGAKKRIEQLEQARASASMKSGQNESVKSHPSTGNKKAGGAVKGSATDRYSKLVEDEIRSHWMVPETRDKSLMAIISITVTKNGSIQKIDFIKSSGNQLFDRSVQRAITKSSLPQDPPDTEVVLRFHP